MKATLYLISAPILGFIFVLASASGQTTSSNEAQPLRIDTATGMKNLRTKPKVVYPTEAKQLHIQGKVELELTVSPSGNVVAERVVSGPPALQQAAIDLFKNMKYRPFLRNGKPSLALVQAAIAYEMDGDAMAPQDQHVGDSFFPAHEKCEELKHQHVNNAIEACREALNLSKRFSTGSELEARTVAYSDLAQLLIESHRELEATSLGDEAVALVSETSKDNQAYVSAHLTRAQTRAAIRDFAGSDEDSTLAESSLRGLARQETHSVFIKMFSDELKNSLMFHAAVLVANGDATRARALREEAGKLH